MVRRGVDRKKVDLVSAHREASCHSGRYYWKRTTSTSQHFSKILNISARYYWKRNKSTRKQLFYNLESRICAPYLRRQNISKSKPFSKILNLKYLLDIIGNTQHQQESVSFSSRIWNLEYLLDIIISLEKPKITTSCKLFFFFYIHTGHIRFLLLLFSLIP